MLTTVAVFKEIKYIGGRLELKLGVLTQPNKMHFFFHLVLLAQCALFAEISTHQEKRQSTLKYS